MSGYNRQRRRSAYGYEGRPETIELATRGISSVRRLTSQADTSLLIGLAAASPTTPDVGTQKNQSLLSIPRQVPQFHEQSIMISDS